jgi:DNA-binding MarR family transcriptional regulator
MGEIVMTGRKGVRRASVLGWRRLARVDQKVDRASSEHLREWDLSVAQFDVLAHVGASEGLTQQELADGLLVTKGNVCQLLDKMERRGLIVRRPEGRANRVYLTPAGRTLFNAVVPAQENLIARLFSVLSADEQRELMRLLGKLDRAMD